MVQGPVRAFVVGCILVSGGAPAQVDRVAGAAQHGSVFRQPGDPQSYVQYGRPEPAWLREIVGGRYRGQAVRTRGALSFADPTSGYLRLADENEQVLVIVVDELQAEARSFVGLRVEVIGLPRALKENQGSCPFLGRVVPQSVCDDPHLPPTPDRAGHPFWPQMSLTIWSITDLTPLESRRGDRDGADAPPTLRELLEAGDSPPRQQVTVRGRFCGRGLCGGLSAAAPSRTAWVLERDGAAVWVVGKEPKGKGWRLDPLSEGDTSRWLEVVGRLETLGAIRCLRADSVLLVRGPAPPP